MIKRLKNIDTIVSCDAMDRIYHNTDLWMEDGVIAALGDYDGVEDTSYDCSGMFLYPGLVNVHHHLYQYFTRNLAKVQGLELFDWLVALYEIWKGLNADTVRLSSLCAMSELMRYGCTTCFDHHYVFPSGQEKLIDTQFEAADELGIRFCASRGSMDLSRKDGGLPPDSVVQSIDAILKDSERLIDLYHDDGDYAMRKVVLAPCSPFSVSAELLKESAVLARQKGVRLHTHLCETKDEENYTLERYGVRPLEYMQSLGWTGPDVFFAHGIHFNDEELLLLAQTQTGIAHCPCSNMKLSSGTMRLPDMLRLGIPVGLGVDGSASNDASNLMDEIRSAYLLHRLTYGDRAPSGYELLKIASAGGAKLLGFEKLGRIETGCAADMFLIRKDRTDLLCANGDPANLFGTVGYHRPCDMVFVNGKLTVQDGELVSVDEDRLYSEADAEIKRLLKEA